MKPRSAEQVREELLVLRCQAHEADAFAELVDRFQGRLYAAALRRSPTPDAARDAVQDTWLTILRELPHLRDPARFPAFAHRILTRRCADSARGAGRRTQLATRLAQATPEDEEPLAERAHDSARLRAALRTLSREVQQLLALRYRQDLSVPEIARKLRLPEGTIKSRLHSARAKLEDALLHPDRAATHTTRRSTE